MSQMQTVPKSIYRYLLQDVEFLSLPPLYCHQRQAKPCIRAVRGGNRLFLNLANYVWTIHSQFSQIYRSFTRKKLMPFIRKNRSISDIETDLMDCLLTAPTIDSPWNPADPDTADYYARSVGVASPFLRNATRTENRDFCLENWSDAELSARSESFLIW
jgi:hypothetical protein